MTIILIFIIILEILLLFYLNKQKQEHFETDEENNENTTTLKRNKTKRSLKRNKKPSNEDIDDEDDENNEITTTVKPSNADIDDEEEEDLPQEIVEKERLRKKDDKLDLNNLEEKLKQSQKLTYTDYINYHKDWIIPPSKPYTCSPPQKYKNTPFVEYKLSNGTPLSFLDETTVGYVLPKFIYKEYK